MKKFRIKSTKYSDGIEEHCVQSKIGLFWVDYRTAHAMGSVYHVYPSYKEAEDFIKKLNEPKPNVVSKTFKEFTFE